MGPSPAYEERIRNDPKRWLHTQSVWSCTARVRSAQENPSLLHERWSGNSAYAVFTAAYAEQHGIESLSTGDGCNDGLHNRNCPQPLPTGSTMLEKQPSLIRKHSPVQIGCMHIAARYADIEMLRLLIDAGGDVNDCTNPKKMTTQFETGHIQFVDAKAMNIISFARSTVVSRRFRRHDAAGRGCGRAVHWD